MKYKSLLSTILVCITLFSFEVYSAAETENPKATKNTKTKIKKNNYSNSNYTYSIPSRMIIVSPYVSCIYANNIFKGAVQDKSAFGAGLNIRTQIYKDFGYMLDFMYTTLKPVEDLSAGSQSKFTGIFAGGFYYTFFNLSMADLRVDMEYGAITSGNNVMTIFMPGVEFFYKVSDRINAFAKISNLLANDWFYNQNYQEHYTSFALSLGFSVIF